MADYQISVSRDVYNADEFRVIVVKDRENMIGGVNALSFCHAKLVARDLMSLIRRKDPNGAFALEPRLQMGDHQSLFIA